MQGAKAGQRGIALARPKGLRRAVRAHMLNDSGKLMRSPPMTFGQLSKNVSMAKDSSQGAQTCQDTAHQGGEIMLKVGDAM